MNLSSATHANNLRLKPLHTTTLFFSNKTSIHLRQFTVYRKRRRFKRLTVKSDLSYSFENICNNLISQFPSANSIDLLAPALGLFSGFALYFSQLNSSDKFSRTTSCFGNWILFTSPTPFNRFVVLRCPSISFKESELLENVNEKLVKEDRHFVTLNSGRIQLNSSGGDEAETNLEYQRLCVGTEDGGVISLDWPANLDLEEEHGLDTTLLLVPGTPEGSMEKNIRLFVCEALKHGFFPVVMNPRGCGGSPLTSARLFTAADSDDISTAIQFINKARPWTTLMGVGWGYGANMLTKYLAEVGERTPLTAATCIDNPFDLEESTRSSPHNISLDQKLTNGLIDILRSNKVDDCVKGLFQGRAKGFDVEKALLSKSVRDFEKAISMVSYGFEAIEDFYSISSTQAVVGNVKIPVLFIQNVDGTVPPFSIPRSLIAENPFTSLLLCSCSPITVIESVRAAEFWCQHLTIEWLTAVELGLLKGRHPLLKDVDVTINPSKGMEGRATDKGIEVKKLWDPIKANTLNGRSIDPVKDMIENGNAAARILLKSRQEPQRNLELGNKGLQEVDNDALQKTSPVDAELVNEEEAGQVDSERGQVLQTAQVVMNMLDATKPGILNEEEKKKVLTAVGQGETFMNALQDAVPEDVRVKLTAAVSGIVHTEGTNLKFDKLLGIGNNNVSKIKSKIQEKVGGLSNTGSGHKDSHPVDQVKRVDDLADGTDNNPPGTDKPADRLEPELHASENLERSVDASQVESVSSHQGDISSSGEKGSTELGNSHENDLNSKEKSISCSEISEKGSEMGGMPNFTGQPDKAEAIVDEHKVDQDVDSSQLETKAENSNQKIGEKTVDSSDQNKKTPANVAEDTVLPLGSSSEAQPMEREGNDNQKRENNNLQPALDQDTTTPDSSPPSFGVSQALDALTGMDDSTQMAVNSVFGVIENMITQFEEGKDDENDVKDRSKVEDEKIESVSREQHDGNDHTYEKKQENGNELSVQSHTICDPPTYLDNSTQSQHDSRTESPEEEPIRSPIIFDGKVTNLSQGNNTAKSIDSEKQKELIGCKNLADYSDLKYINNLPLCLAVNMPNTKPLDVDTTTALLLDYIPEEGKWKLLEQPGNVGDPIGNVTTYEDADREVQFHSFAKVNDADKVIEPLYVILDTDQHQEPVGEFEMKDNTNENVVTGEDTSKELMHFVKNIIMDSLKVEVDRRLSPSDRKKMKSDLARDLEEVANSVALAVQHNGEHSWCLDGKYYSIDSTSEKAGTIHGENTIRAISSAVQGTSYLRRVLPVGVIVGSSLAALRKYFNVCTGHDNGQKEPLVFDQTKKSVGRKRDEAKIAEISRMPVEKNTSLNGSTNKEGIGAELKSLNNDSVMVGAITVALGASALLVNQQDSYKGKEAAAENSSKPFNEKENHQKAHNKLEEAMSGVTSLAEKAMSVASPVVPTKECGEVDEERLVAMLADLGQKGGMLKLVGKIALLWGGIRGAMSLTDKLISFLHIAERPLFQRILGFVGMVLVLWSPVAVPLLPSLMQSWTTNNPSRFAEVVCVVGLYMAVMILVMIWGRRIRGYKNPLQQYGLDVTSPSKVQNFLKGLAGGVMLVLLIQSVNALLGFASFSWPSRLPSSINALTWLKVYVKMLFLACRGILTATAVVLVEELLFRSWLPQEIAVDLGYHRGIIISGLAYALFQRSPQAIPGLWLLSLALAGARQRCQGSLFPSIGLHAGIMASSFVLQAGCFLAYNPSFPLWVTGTHPFQPFTGVVGLAFSLLLAIILYPRQPLVNKKFKTIIRKYSKMIW
ncbi:hypothetical protein EZV62_013067 [Acer yangbiense]|uniref:CAAX amino terminal protease n=1 Tax=Acer yangbiense TaxID=1000413 RepID=A0A5C7HXY8_9ROSI|nr:hypothetical protein EZV62_013067 [Acer yangbiense]